MKLFVVLAFIATSLFSVAAQANSNCWCHIKVPNKDGTVLHGYPSLAQYGTLQLSGKEADCSAKCSQRSSSSQDGVANVSFANNIRSKACATGAAHNSKIYAYSKAGANYANNPHTTYFGQVKRTGAVLGCDPGYSLQGDRCWKAANVVTAASCSVTPN
jgi:hypothetical protein